MNKSIFYIAFALIVAGVLYFSFTKHAEKEDEIMPLKERNAVLAKDPEWPQIRAKATNLFNFIKKDKADKKSMLELASLYIQEARVTGDRSYYDMAAMKLVKGVLKLDSVNFEALAFKATIQLSQHHFLDGLKTGEQLVKVNPYNSFVYGVLVDANVELGHYDNAVKMSDKMVTTRPDIRSYSRIAYLREIYGDIPGAKHAMKMAIQAGYPGMEQTEWAMVQLGHLYEISGQLDTAQLAYNSALTARPGYAYAYAGLARVAKAMHNYKDAIKDYEMAKQTVNDYSFDEELSSLYALTGDKQKSKDAIETAIGMLNADAKSANSNDQLGHYADRELAYAYIQEGEYDKALDHALLEYNRRPDNIDVNETLAWVYYLKGDYDNAYKHSQVAMKTGSKNPVANAHEGLIMIKAGKVAEGKQLIQAAMNMYPYMDNDLKTRLTQVAA